MNIIIKSSAKDKRIGHSGISKPLGEQSKEDLIKLGILAHTSGNSLLLNMFDKLPSLPELRGEKVESALSKVVEVPVLPAPIVPSTVTPVVEDKTKSPEKKD